MLLRFFDYHTKELVGKYNDMDDYLEKVGGMAKGDPIRISRENGVTITGVVQTIGHGFLKEGYSTDVYFIRESRDPV